MAVADEEEGAVAVVALELELDPTAAAAASVDARAAIGAGAAAFERGVAIALEVPPRAMGSGTAATSPDLRSPSIRSSPSAVTSSTEELAAGCTTAPLPSAFAAATAAAVSRTYLSSGTRALRLAFWMLSSATIKSRSRTNAE